MPRKRPGREIRIEVDSGNRSAVSSSELLVDRILRSRQDRVWVSRLVAVSLLGIGIANFAPSLITVFSDSEVLPYSSIPRWMYTLPFVGFLHVIYAIFLIQIPDWTSLRSVSIFQLIVAGIFGFLTVALLLGGADGKVARFLELPFGLVPRAIIWSISMLLIELGGSFLAGTEASNWKKMESLLRRVPDLASTVENGKN